MSLDLGPTQIIQDDLSHLEILISLIALTKTLSLSVCLSFCLFRATPAAYGGSQARGPIRAVGAGLCLGHSNFESELCL